MRKGVKLSISKHIRILIGFLVVCCGVFSATLVVSASSQPVISAEKVNRLAKIGTLKALRLPDGWSPDGSLAAYLTNDSLAIYKMITCQLFGTVPMELRPIWERILQMVRLSPNNRYIAFKFWKSKVTILDIQLKATTYLTCSDNGDFAFSPDSTLIACDLTEKGTLIWDLQTARQKNIFPHSVTTYGNVEFSPNGKMLLSTSGDGLLSVWDLRSQTLLFKRECCGSDAGLSAALFTQDSSMVILQDTESTSNPKTGTRYEMILHALSLQAGIEQSSVDSDSYFYIEPSLLAHHAPILFIGDAAIYTASSQEVRVLNLHTMKVQLWVRRPFSWLKEIMDVSPDGHLLVLATYDTQGEIWDTVGDKRLLLWSDIKDFNA